MDIEARKSLERLAWVAGILLLGMVIASAVERRSLAGAQGLEVRVHALSDGNFMIKEKDVRKLIDNSFGTDLAGERLRNLDLERMERVLEEEPFILDANVYLDAANMIRVEVHQRRAMLRVKDSNGLDYYLDESGVRMPVSRHFTARVMVATGGLPPYTADFMEKPDHLLRQLFDLTQHLLADQFMSALVEQIHVSKGDFVLVPKLGNHKIVIGPAHDLDDKIDRLKIFYEEVLSREGWQKYDRIDLRFDGQVVAGT